MQTRCKQFIMAIGLILACASSPALGQGPSRSTSPKTLWSVLGIPKIAGKSNSPAANQRQLPLPQSIPNASPADVPIEAKPIAEMPTTESASAPEDVAPPLEENATVETDFDEPFTKVNVISTKRSSRRSAILQRDSARIVSDDATPSAKPRPLSLPLTPHWIPPQESESVLLNSNARERSVRPVAVTVSGELLSDHVPLTLAITKFDGSLGLTPQTPKRTARRAEFQDDLFPTTPDSKPSVALTSASLP